MDCENYHQAYRYHGYNLIIESCLPLPELQRRGSASESADIKISLGTVESHPQQLDETGRGFWMQGSTACYCLDGVGAFLVSEGRYILVEPQLGADPEALRLSVLGPALALALYQRGLFTLHASAVAIDGKAVAFLGGHGWGKSTMAALLHARGYPVISDDVTALNEHDNTVVPSFPQLKLWPSALGAVGMSSNEFPQVHPALEKRAVRFTEGFAPCPLPLQRMYLLNIGQPIAIETLQPSQALEEIMRHWYGVRFGSAFFNSLDLREHFLRVSRLARTVSIRRLRRPGTLMDDPDLPAALEREILQDLEHS
jgi:hypothetical protein